MDTSDGLGLHPPPPRNDEVEIEFTGLRPGEKLIEELYYADEIVSETSCPKIKRAQHTSGVWNELQSQLDELRTTLYVDGANPIRAKMKEIIPEFQYSLEMSPPEVAAPRSAAIGA